MICEHIRFRQYKIHELQMKCWGPVDCLCQTRFVWSDPSKRYVVFCIWKQNAWEQQKCFVHLGAPQIWPAKKSTNLTSRKCILRKLQAAIILRGIYMGKHFFPSSPNLKHICLLFFSESLFRWGCEEEMLRKVLNVLTCLFSTWWYSNLVDCLDNDNDQFMISINLIIMIMK